MLKIDRPAAILYGGHYHQNGAAITPRDAPDYVVDGPCYVIPEDTFNALILAE